MAISGNTLVVGAKYESSAATGINGNQADNSARISGAVYVFVLENGAWTQQAYIKASNTRGGDPFGNPGDFFGHAVDIDGDTLVVGATRERSKATGVNGSQADDQIDFAGAAYVFVRSGTTWSQQAYIKPSNTVQERSTGLFFEFGSSVAIDGDTVAIGALGEPSNATGINGNQSDRSKPYSGAVYVFTRNGSNWSQQAYIKASNADANDQFGAELDLSNNTLVVGAPNEFGGIAGINGNQSDNSMGFAGAGYVFTRTGSSWSQQAYLKASNPNAADLFGSSIRMDGQSLLVGAPQEDSNATGVDGDQADNTTGQAGAAYLFVRDGTTWSQQAYLKGSNPGYNARFGTSVALSGDLAFIGAPGESGSATGVGGTQDQAATGAGAVYRFIRSGVQWSQSAYIKASNTDAGDAFGSSLALGGDILAVGASAEDSLSPGVDADQQDNSGNQPGAVYVFNNAAGGGFSINAGLNDAWVFAGAPFQGMFVTVYPVLKLIFIAWFTFDSVPPPGDATAVFGAPDQRWVTAVGTYDGNLAVLNAELTGGGGFNSSEPLPVQDTEYGTISLEFSGCSAAEVMYSFPGPGLSGSFMIERAVPGNVALCEALSTP